MKFIIYHLRIDDSDKDLMLSIIDYDDWVEVELVDTKTEDMIGYEYCYDNGEYNELAHISNSIMNLPIDSDNGINAVLDTIEAIAKMSQVVTEVT